MAAKIRVYELARELGLSNKETLDLCEQLGIGVKSHSSSIVEAQADRVRRKADQLGLRREVEAEPEPEKPAPETAAPETAAKPEPEKAAPAPAARAEAVDEVTVDKVAADKAAVDKAADEPAPEKVEAEEPAVPEGPELPAEPEARPAAAGRDPDHRLVTSRPASEQDEVPSRPAARPRPARPVPPPPPPPRPTAPPPRPAERPAAPQRGGDSEPARPAARQTPPPSERRPARPTPPPPARPDGPSGPPSRPPSGPPRAASGKPIPPPPGPPRSSSGKPIPPPPGQGGRGTTRPAPTGAPSRRPGGGGGGGRGMPSVPRGAVPGAGGPGGRGGPRGAPRRPRRGRRRRRSMEELEPQEIPTYTPEDTPVPEGEVIIERGSTPKDVGPKLNRSAADVVRFLLQQGEMVTATQSLTDEMIELFAAEIAATVRLVDPGEEQEAELKLLLDADAEEEEDEAALQPRPPVITVMGHVDHGKTLLLDRIRETNVVEGEAGGITQHIGAYQVERNGQRITFVDTPGHEAFTAMRARGAQVTDIVVLVVAADDGVMPQTVEALNHARAADVPIIVAINKVDRENADVNRVMQQLSEHDLVPEAWGGETIVVQVSALQGMGIEELLENILVVAELEELGANPDGRARGVVLESNLDVGRGPVATVIVERGTLQVGDPVVAGAAWGRVRALIDDTGEQVKEAGPSMPVQMLGLSDVADAGDDFVVAPDDRTARTVAEQRAEFARRARTAVTSAATTGGGVRLEDIFEQIQRGEAATLNLVLKADVTGSLEALTDALKKLERDEVKLSFVHRGVGGISESDVQLGAASQATIIGFNVRPDRNARELAEAEDVEVRTYEIIYQVIEDIENAMVGLLQPEYEEVVTGEAEVREIFRVPRIGAIAGCYVLNGTITRGSKVRFLRDGTVIWKGTITSLRRFKDDVREVNAGFECGIGLSDFQDLKQGDIIETFEEREIPRT